MNLIKSLGSVIALSILLSCGSGLPDNYHMKKKYWDVSDYDAALRQLKYNTSKEEGYPRISDPKTASVFYKLVDEENVSIVLEDEELGLKHRNEVAQEFFDASKDIIKIYQVLDNQDKFVYPVELVSAIEFGLHTQLLYFKVGNAEIIKNTINPESTDIKRLITSNEQIIADNFNNYIEFLAREDAFSKIALDKYAEVIDTYYSKLIEEFPSANYGKMKSMASTVKNKVKSLEIKSALENLILKIDNSK